MLASLDLNYFAVSAHAGGVSVQESMKSLVTIITLILLSACSQKAEHEVVIPMYKSCLQVVPNYLLSLNQKGYSIEHTAISFSQTHEAHPGLVGSYTLASNNKENLEVALNGLKLKCFPKTKVSTDADALGLKVLTSEQLKNENKETEFIRVSKGQLNYYYPSPE